MFYIRFITLTSLLHLLATAAWAQTSANRYEIAGVFKGLRNGKVMLGNKPDGYNSAFKVVYFDSCFARNDSFYFSGHVNEPDFYSIEIGGQPSWRTFILSNSRITIAGHKDSTWKATVSGAPEHETYRSYINNVDYSPLRDTLDLYNAKLNKARQENDSISFKKYIDSVALYNTKLIQDRLHFFEQNPASFISLYKLYSLLPQLNIDTAQKYYNKLQPNLKDHSLGKKLKYELFEVSKVTGIGQTLPLFSLPDTSGRLWPSSTYKGKYVLFDFWASWCTPCLEELPALDTVYSSYHHKGFEIVGISLDSKRSKWIEAVKKHHIKWPTWSDLNGNENKAAQLFGIKEIPQKYLVDPTGTLVLKNPTPAELSVYLGKHLH